MIISLLVIPVFADDVEWSVVCKGLTNNRSSSRTISNGSPSATFAANTKITSYVLTAPAAGNYYISFFATGSTVNSVTGATDWSFSDNTTSILLTVSDPGTFNITVDMTVCSYEISTQCSYAPSSGGGGTVDKPTYDMNGFHGESKAISGVGQTVWEIYNTYIGQQNATITVDNGTMLVEAWSANLLSNLAYVGWSWQYDYVNNTIEFTVPEESRGSWADMLYRTAVWGYFWNRQIMTNNVAGSWYGSISSSFDTLNASVFRILTVLANDEDLAIKNATDDERQWVQNWFEGDSSDTSRFDSVNSVSSNVSDVFSGIDSSIDVGTAFTSTDEGYTFWSQGCYDEIFNVDASGFVSSTDSSTFSRSSPSGGDDSQVIYDAFSARWERIVNPID